MKKSLVTLVLAFAALAAAQQSTAPAAPPAQSAQPAQQKKEIKDPAEYNSYIAALREANPQAQAQAFENFLQQYPNTVVKEDALEQLMAAYEKLGNAAKTSGDRRPRPAGRSQQCARPGAAGLYQPRRRRGAARRRSRMPPTPPSMVRRGLRALATMSKPEGMSDADFEKFKTQVAIIFNGSAGFGALQNKDYAGAQKYLQAAVELEIKQNPNDPNALRDIYPLALAYLEAKPINPTGLWWIARAAALSNNNPQIVKYGQFKYTKYHGSPDGWDQLLAQAKASRNPAGGFRGCARAQPGGAGQAAGG